MAKTKSLNIALNDEMKKFIVNQSGSGTLYTTPSEYVSDLIRHERDRFEAAKLRSDIIEGYQDAIHGRVHEFSGDLMADLKAHRNSKLQSCFSPQKPWRTFRKFTITLLRNGVKTRRKNTSGLLNTPFRF